MKIRLVYTGRSYQTAESLPEELVLAAGARLVDALRAVEDCLADGERLPATCLVSLAGRHRGTIASYTNDPLSDGEELVLIAPVAGG